MAELALQRRRVPRQRAQGVRRLDVVGRLPDLESILRISFGRNLGKKTNLV
jgi:hypothetical protein